MPTLGYHIPYDPSVGDRRRLWEQHYISRGMSIFRAGELAGQKARKGVMPPT